MVLSGWDGYDEYTPTEVVGTSTGYVAFFPASSASTTWKSKAESDGSDLAITTLASDTKIAFELSKDYDPSTGAGGFWFGPLTDTAASEKTYRIYAGNTGASETEDPATVWADTASVWHLEEDPSGTAPQVVDSGPLGNDGTSAGSMASGDLVSGKIGDALDFDGSDDYIDSIGAVSDYSFVQNTKTFCIMAWIKLASIDNALYAIIANSGSGSQKGFFFGWANRSSQADERKNVKFEMFTGSGNAISDFTSSIDSVADTNWHHVAVTGDGSNFRIYVDGSQDGSDTYGGSISGDSANTLDLAAITGVVTFKGLIDEVRFYDVHVDGDEIATEYAVQNSPSTFATFGGWTAISTGGTEDEIDSFEDGDYTSNPTWSDDSTGTAAWLVNTDESYDGSYSALIDRTAGSVGDDYILTHTRPSTDSAPVAGDSWYCYILQTSVTGESSAKFYYKLIDAAGDYVRVECSGTLQVVNATNGTNTGTANTMFSNSTSTWYKLTLDFYDNGGTLYVKGAFRNSNGTIVEQTSGIDASALGDISDVEFGYENSQENGNAHFDSVKYGASGEAAEVSDNGLFFGAGA